MHNNSYFILVDHFAAIFLDVNECNESTDGCAQMCTNEIGGYSCSCGSGYRLATNGQGCLDVNECAEGTHGCDHTCTNTIGSYICSCDSGYRLATDRQMCNGELISIPQSKITIS